MLPKFNKLYDESMERYKGGKMVAWDVYKGDKLIDTVSFNSECDAEYVKDSLIKKDGFSSDIVVKVQEKK